MRARWVLLVLSLLLGHVAAYAEETTIMRFIDENLDRVPIHTVVPEYPIVARRDRIEGEVQVCYQIDRKGRPYRVAVRHSTHRLFERPVIRAIRASSYKALEHGETQSGIKSCRTFKFELQPVLAEADEPPQSE